MTCQQFEIGMYGPGEYQIEVVHAKGSHYYAIRKTGGERIYTCSNHYMTAYDAIIAGGNYVSLSCAKFKQFKETGRMT